MRKLIAGLVFALSLFPVACGGGKSVVPPSTTTSTTRLPAPTTTLNPVAALASRPHTLDDCTAAFQKSSYSAPVTDVTTCMKSATDLPPTVRSGFRLEVDGSGGALVTYSLKGGNTAQQQVTLPWALEVADPYPEGQVLIAQLSGSGTITCRILSETNHNLAEVSSSGQGVIATCNHAA